MLSRAQDRATATSRQVSRISLAGNLLGDLAGERTGGRAGHGDQQIAELDGCRAALAAREPVQGAPAQSPPPLVGRVISIIKPCQSRRASPVQRRGWGTDEVEPCRLARAMSVEPLLHAACPSAAIIRDTPSSGARRPVQPESAPGVRGLGVLEHAAKSAHGLECRGEAAAVVAKNLADADHGAAEPVASPPGTWRVCDDGVWPRVESGISRFIPGIDSRESKVHPPPLYVERGNHRVGRAARYSATSAAANRMSTNAPAAAPRILPRVISFQKCHHGELRSGL